MKIVVINTSNSNNRNFNTFTNIIFWYNNFNRGKNQKYYFFVVSNSNYPK